jgi:hypothetical protein
MFRFLLIAPFAVVLVQSVPGRASADLIQCESLDLAVMNSALVIRGEVIEIVSKKGENVVWNQVTVRVNETIKGEKFKEVKFLVREGPFDWQGAAWRNMQDEMLLCLNAADSNRGGFDKTDFVLRGDSILLNGAPGRRGGTYSLKVKALTDRKEILAAALAAADDRARKPGAKLERIVQSPDVVEWPLGVLYPDSERVRTAAKKLGIELLPY